MQTLLVVVLVVIEGWASQYSPGVMEEVHRNRTGGMPGIRQLEISPRLPGIAVSDCGEIGSIRAIRYDGYGWSSAQVVDCARPGDGTAEWMKQEQILLEMGHVQAERLGIVGRGIRVEMVTWEIVQVQAGEIEGPVLVMDD